jgi:hypothetical protein
LVIVPPVTSIAGQTPFIFACHFDLKTLGKRLVQEDLKFDRITVELLSEYPLNLCTYRAGDCKLVLREGAEERSIRCTSKFERGDPYVCVQNNDHRLR